MLKRSVKLPGFVEAKEGNKYMPKDKTTLGELIHIVTRISDFANK